jgi:flagellar biosynthesis protein FlhA
MAINPGTASAPVEGTATKEPAFGLPAFWIPAAQREQVSALGYTVVDPTTALSTHVSETIRGFLPDLLSRQQTKELVDRVAQSSPRLVEDLIPKVFSLGDVQRVLRQLLRERVPVRDLVTILEAMADSGPNTKDPDALTEAVRSAMGRTICRQYQNDRGELPAISLTPGLETKLMSAIVRTEQGPVLALEPTQAQQLASRIAEALAGALAQPVLLCTPMLRPHLWKLFTRVLPHMGVLSHNEVPAQMRVATVAVLD